MGSPRARLPVGVQVNQVVRLLSAPCQGKWSLGIETAIAPIGEALWVLLTPDPKQILQNYLRPKGGRAGGRFLDILSGRRKMATTDRTVRMWGGGFPDVDEMIGDSLPGRKFFAGRTAGALEKWFWTGIELSDAIGFYWLLADVGANGLLHWSSNLFHSLICHPTSTFAGSWTLFYNTGGIKGLWDTPFHPWLHDEKNCAFGFNGDFHPADGLPVKGIYVNAISLFRGQGAANQGPFTLRLFLGVVEVYNESDGSAEALGFFEEGNLQCEAHFEYEGMWDRGELSMVNGGGSGYRIDGANFEGQIFGGFD